MPDGQDGQGGDELVGGGVGVGDGVAGDQGYIGAAPMPVMRLGTRRPLRNSAATDALLVAGLDHGDVDRLLGRQRSQDRNQSLVHQTGLEVGASGRRGGEPGMSQQASGVAAADRHL